MPPGMTMRTEAPSAASAGACSWPLRLVSSYTAAGGAGLHHDSSFGGWPGSVAPSAASELTCTAGMPRATAASRTWRVPSTFTRSRKLTVAGTELDDAGAVEDLVDPDQRLRHGVGVGDVAHGVGRSSRPARPTAVAGGPNEGDDLVAPLDQLAGQVGPEEPAWLR